MQKKHHHDHLAMQTFYFWLYIFFRFFSSFDLYNVWHRQKEKTHTVETEKIVLFWQKHTPRQQEFIFSFCRFLYFILYFLLLLLHNSVYYYYYKSIYNY